MCSTGAVQVATGCQWGWVRMREFAVRAQVDGQLPCMSPCAAGKVVNLLMTHLPSFNSVVSVLPCLEPRP
jgi:hypothetical protein